MERVEFSVPVCVDEALLIGSLGLDCATVAASLRAGLSRPAPLHECPMTTEDGDDADLIGHPVNLLTDGFEGAGRYGRLLERVFDDVAAVLDARTKVRDEPCYLLVGVPSSERYSDGVDIESGEELDPDDTGFGLSGNSWGGVIDGVLELTGTRERFTAVRVVETTNVRCTMLLRMAHEALASRPGSRVLLVTVDTLADEPGLRWLERTGRLRSPTHPVGVAPGEAVAALFLSSRRESRTLELGPILHATEPNAMFDDALPEGKALAGLLAAFAAARVDVNGAVWTIANQTGEQRQAYEWGMATLHCRAQASLALDGLPELPAMFVGDVGVSFMCFAIALVTQAHARGYAPASDCGIVLVDHTGERALVTVRRAR